MYSSSAFITFVFLLIHDALCDDTIVELPYGKIRGRQEVTFNNNTIYIFQKVPYAAPPVGPLRFQPPQTHRGWNGVLDTQNLDITCFQTTARETPHETEDCLILNIFTPRLDAESQNVLLPVMFYIHGGAFVEGSSHLHPGDRFVDEGVVYVSINYRVGPLGFLYTEDDVIPGNNGLRDQQFALNWVYNHIYLFGGNKNKITVFGASAGAASVSYQLLKQETSGLIVGAILQSGTFLGTWAFQRRPKEIAFATAALLNSSFSTNRNSKDLLNFLLSVDASAIDKASEQYYDNLKTCTPKWLQVTTGYYWAPVVEVDNPTAFLTEKMYKQLKNKYILKVPLIIGMTSEEGLFFNTDRASMEYNLKQYDKHIDWLVPNNMPINDTNEKIKMGTKIRDIYTGGKNLTGNIIASVKYITDVAFTRPLLKFAELYSMLDKTYFYEFTHHGELPGVNNLFDGAGSVAHGEELRYLFCRGSVCNIDWAPKEDQIISKRFMKLWTNFAKYQHPTPKKKELLQNIIWPMMDTNFPYLEINKNLEIKNHPKKEVYNKWIELYNSLHFDEFDTY